MTNILILVGSQRQGFNAALARAVLEECPPAAITRLFDGLARLPHFHEGLDADGVDATVDALRAAVRDSDALLLVTPEYNGGPSSLIKNALDVISRPRGSAAIDQKPVAVIGATPSPGATASARAGLRLGVQRAGGRLVEATMGVGRAHEHLSDDSYGPEVRAELAGVLAELVAAAQPVVAG